MIAFALAAVLDSAVLCPPCPGDPPWRAYTCYILTRLGEPPGRAGCSLESGAPERGPSFSGCGERVVRSLARDGAPDMRRGHRRACRTTAPTRASMLAPGPRRSSRGEPESRWVWVRQAPKAKAACSVACATHAPSPAEMGKLENPESESFIRRGRGVLPLRSVSAAGVHRVDRARCSWTHTNTRPAPSRGRGMVATETASGNARPGDPKPSTIPHQCAISADLEVGPAMIWSRTVRWLSKRSELRRYFSLEA